ncbi:hypothetical protein [Flavobacterium sp.]|uniref:hypothetical protein n=1 Tax=Flavobacterium sp. TaxID=239 RepID=UPI003B9A7F45
MRKFCLLFLLCLPTLLQAQVYRFKATSFSITERLDNDSWSDWTPFEESTVVITLDGKKERITIASKEIQVFEIMEYAEKIETDEDIIIGFRCANLDGAQVEIDIITRKKQNNRKQIYVNYSDVRYVYNVYD